MTVYSVLPSAGVMKKPWAKALGPQNTYAVVTILALLFTLPLVAVFDVKDMAAVYQQVRHCGVGCCLCSVCTGGVLPPIGSTNVRVKGTFHLTRTSKLICVQQFSPSCDELFATSHPLPMLTVPSPCVTQVQAMGTGMDVLKYSALSGLTFYLYNEASFQVPYTVPTAVM
jgi:hypothetical protein